MTSNEQVEQLRRTLECSICLEQTTDPRALPCLHSYCEKCLTRHMAEKGEHGVFPCPLCCAQFPVPKEGASGFKRNFFIANISEILLKNDAICCDICKHDGSDVLALFICTQCRIHLCKECSHDHCRHTNDHRVERLDEVRNGQHMDEIRRHQKVYCSVHKDKVLDIYCEQCEIPICSLCYTFNHNQHKVTDLGDAAHSASGVMRNLLGPWKNVTQHYEMLCEKRQQMLQRLGQKQEACKTEIKRLFSEFVAEIKAHEENVIDQLDEQVEAAKKQAETECDEAELSREKFANVLQYVNSILTSAHDAEKLQHFREIRKRLGNLNVNHIETQVNRAIFKIQPEKLVLPNLGVKVITKLQNENISPKLPPIAVPRRSSVPRETLQPAVEERARLVRKFSSLRKGEQVGVCTGLAVGDLGLLITDNSNKNVKVFDKNDFTFKFTLNKTQHQLQSPVDVTLNGQGETFITDLFISGVVKYDTAGHVMKVYRNVYKDWGHITCHDQLIVADTQGGRVILTDYDCKVHRKINARTLGLSTFSPHNVCVDENTGHLIVSEWHPGRVHVIDCTRPAIIDTYTDKLGDEPRGVCVDQFGNILVADYYNHQVILFTSARAHVPVARGDVCWPTGVCVLGPGQVSVLQSDGEVKIFTYMNI